MRTRLTRLVAGFLLIVSSLVAAVGGGLPAGAAECVPLTEADLAFGAPAVQDDNGACYGLPSVTGDVLLLATPGQVSIVDSGGVEQCASVEDALARCELSGVAPFRTTSTFSSVRISRLNNPAGCSTFTPAPFGSPAADPLELTLAYGDYGCATGSLAAGPHRMLVDRYLPWAWYDVAGAGLCEGSRSAACDLGSSADVTVVFSRGDDSPIHATAVPLAGTNPGCVDASTSWAEAPLTVGATTPQMDCLSFMAEAGQRILPVAERTYDIPGEGEVVDSSGAAVCSEVSGTLGCELAGAPPYRLLTWGPTTTYRAVVRDVTGMAGCPVLSPSAFGTDASDAHPGIGCRRLSAATSAAHVLKTSIANYQGVYGSDGSLVCEDQDVTCELTSGEAYLLVVDPLTVSFRTSFHRLTGGGCGSTLRAGVAGQWEGSISPRQVDCVKLAYPSGAVVTLLQPVDYRTPVVAVVDSAGTLQCLLGLGFDACDLAGTAPFRALSWDDLSRKYHVVIPRLDKPAGCDRATPGAWGTSRGSTLTLPRGRVAACVTVSGSAFRGWNLVGWDRRSGSGSARVFSADPTGACEIQGDEEGGVETCTAGPPLATTVSLLLSTDGAGGRWKIVHRNLRSGSGCVDAAGRRPRSPATTGRLADPLQFDCVDLPATADEEFVTHFDGRDYKATMSVYPLGGLDRVCLTRYSEDCRFSGFDGYRLVANREFYARRAVPYRIEPVRIRTAEKWDSRCVRFSDYSDGFGPHRGTLSNRQAVECVVVEDVDGRTSYDMTVKVTDGSDRIVVPYAVSARPESPASCDWVVASRYVCSGFTAFLQEDGDSGLILLSRFLTGDPVPFRLKATR